MAAPERKRAVGAAEGAGPGDWLATHRADARGASARIARTPLASLLTVTVIGIALALPVGLHLAVTNLRALAGAWEGAARISVFMTPAAGDAGAARLAERLRGRDGLARVEVITREQALAEFTAQSGFGAALEMLDENPLPAVVVVTPTAAGAEPARIEALRAELAGAPGVDAVELDARWLARLQAMLEIARRAVGLLAALFALAVVVIVGNTIRLDIQNRRQEIEVAKLIGATDGWIQRPFLYEGAWYGVAGGVAALTLVAVALSLLAGPVAQLAGLYGSDRGLVGLDLRAAASVLVGGAALGWLGSWVAVARHLSEIEPT